MKRKSLSQISAELLNRSQEEAIHGSAACACAWICDCTCNDEQDMVTNTSSLEDSDANSVKKTNFAGTPGFDPVVD